MKIPSLRSMLAWGKAVAHSEDRIWLYECRLLMAFGDWPSGTAMFAVEVRPMTGEVVIYETANSRGVVVPFTINMLSPQ